MSEEAGFYKNSFAWILDKSKKGRKFETVSLFEMGYIYYTLYVLSKR